MKNSEIAPRNWALGDDRKSRSPPGIGGCEIEQVNKVDVMEIYSPPRVTVQAKKYGLRSGEAMDLATGYDFNNPEGREKFGKL